MEMNYKSTAEKRCDIDGVPVFCAYDEIVPLEKIIPNPKNPNTHSKEQIQLLSDIIAATGWRAPITVSTRSGFIVAGHGRLEASRKMGAKSAPVEYQNFTSEAEEYAALVADNRIAELAEINNTMLADILSDINTGEIPLELTGYTEDDLENILTAMAGDDDAEPNDQDNEVEQPCSPMSKRGDLWILGEHRLICGDSTNEETIARLMDGELAAMVHTDPPYGVSFTGGEGKTWDMIKNDAKTGDDLLHTLLIPVFNIYRKNTIAKAAFYIWHASSTRRDFEDALMAAGLLEKQYITWAKNNIQMGRSDYQWDSEFCFYCEKDGETCNFYGDRAQHTVWRITQCLDGAMMTVLGGGIVLTDGKGNKIFIADKAPKGKKVRYVRMEQGKSLDLYQEDRMDTVWKVDRETGYLHPCLPAGQKVFFNNKWMNIEEVKEGDSNRYGHVIATSSHDADKLIEIKVGRKKTIATWNHPFLVQKKDGIYWVNAENIKEGDKLVDVWEKNIKQQKKDISDTEATEKEQGWNIALFGKELMEKSQKACKFIIKTLTKKTTNYPICNLSLPLNTNGFTKVVSLKTENGSNHAKDAENISHVTMKTGIFPEDGSTENSAENATKENRLKHEKGLLKTVGSVRIIQKRTKVYNLTMSGTPAFDTEIGLSHNTQKPVELAARAIENSSQPGEIVLDFFGGSGSTLLAAEQLGRRCFTSELDPVYSDVIVSRYVMATGNLGVKCIRGGQEYKYMDMVEQWAKDNGKEEELASMKTPVVVVTKKALNTLTKEDAANEDEYE